MTPSAKAAQQIYEQAAKQCVDVFCTYASMQPEVYYKMQDALSPIIQQSLSDSLLPYRELEATWRKRAAASKTKGKATKPSTYLRCADELEALIKEAGK